MTTRPFTFSKSERLCSQKTIQFMFEDGLSFVKYPFRVTYLPQVNPEGAPAQILISVSKKKFKRAYKRNRIKRMIREAYRLNKHPFLDHLNDKHLQLAVSFVYLPHEILDYAAVEKGMKKALKQLVSISTTNDDPENRL